VAAGNAEALAGWSASPTRQPDRPARGNQVSSAGLPGYARGVAGQTGLTGQQRSSLAEDGYLLVPSVLASEITGRLARRLEDRARAIVDEWDATPDMRREEAGVVSLRLDLADPDFAACVQHPLLFSAADAVIGPGCQVNGLSLRAPLPGCGHQGLHPDFFPRQRISGPWQVLAAMWCITAFTPDNGPLRVIPGSHRTARDPVDDMAWPGMGPHPDEVRLIAPAGSLILFNSASLWHSGTLNYSPGPRLAVTAYLAPPKAQTDRESCR
jgi:ectoine hydroxylase-related dioxygenase (phytanoyl-CoA dioxygenase family)